MADETKDTVVIGSFDLTTNLPSQNGGQLVIHGYLYNNDDEASINERLDIFSKIAKRRFEVNGIEMREAERRKHVENLERVREIYGALVEKQKNGAKLIAQEKQQLEQGPATIKAALANIEKIEKDMAEVKEKFGIA